VLREATTLVPKDDLVHHASEVTRRCDFAYSLGLTKIQSLPYITLREFVLFYARLRMDPDISMPEREEKVDTMINALKLQVGFNLICIVHGISKKWTDLRQHLPYESPSGRTKTSGHCNCSA